MNTIKSIGENLYKYLCVLGVIVILIGSFQLGSSTLWHSNPMKDQGSDLQIAGTVISALGLGIWYVKKLDPDMLFSRFQPELARNQNNAYYRWLYRWGAMPSAVFSTFLVVWAVVVFVRGWVHPLKSTGDFLVGTETITNLLRASLGMFLIILGCATVGLLSISRSANYRQARTGSIANILSAIAALILGLVLYFTNSTIFYYGADYNLLFPLGILAFCCACAGLSVLPILVNPILGSK